MNDPKVKEFLQGYASHKLIVASQDSQQQMQTGAEFVIEVFIRHSWRAMLEPRRQHRRRRALADMENTTEAANDKNSGQTPEGQVTFPESIERELKEADDADERNFQAMAQQRLMPRPLIFTAKCVSVVAAAGGASQPKAEVVSYVARYATDAEMQKADQEGQVCPVNHLMSCSCCA